MSESDTPSAEQLDSAALIGELRRAKVSDLLAGTCSMLASMAYGKLAPEVGDLEEARLAIDALVALQPLLPEDARRDVQQVVANLQLTYADLTLAHRQATREESEHAPQAPQDEDGPAERSPDAGTAE